MKMLALLAVLSTVDAGIGCINAILKHEFSSTVIKDGCLKKVAILVVGAVAILIAKYFPEFDYLKLTVTPFIISEITSIKELINKIYTIKK